MTQARGKTPIHRVKDLDAPKFVDTDTTTESTFARLVDKDGRSLDTRSVHSDQVSDLDPEIESIKGNKIMNKDGVELDLDESRKEKRAK